MQPEQDNPYLGLPGSAFWRSGVAEASPFDLRDIYKKKFDLTPKTRVATAGSCFAQHISHHLRERGYRVLDTEPAPSWLPKDQHVKYGYSTYSARYGNIYTVPQLLQLAREAAGTFTPASIVWEKEGRFYDALRPGVEPNGLESEAEVRRHRDDHLIKVVELFKSADLMIFTLGLTEAWRHKASGTIYPTAPGTIAGKFDPNEFEFVNFGFDDLARAFLEFMRVLRSIRMRGIPRFLLTVSPVPLTATASGSHVLQATTYSKCVLRAFAGHMAMHHEHVDYFPSYEIITNQSARGVFFENNMRSVRPEGVETVMRHFFKSHALPDSTPMAVKRHARNVQSATAVDQSESAEKDDIEIQCEEAILEAFGG